MAARLKDSYAYNPTAAKALLTAAGYPNGFTTDVVADASGDLDLLQIVKSYFTALVLTWTLRQWIPAHGTSYVRTQKKQDALAYRSSGQIGMFMNR